MSKRGENPTELTAALERAVGKAAMRFPSIATNEFTIVLALYMPQFSELHNDENEKINFFLDVLCNTWTSM